MLKENLVQYFQNSIRANWEQKALSDYKGETLLYKDVADRIVLSHTLFEEIGIVKGDKIALIGKNSANWAVLYLSVVTYGAVVVPILPDFMPSDVQHIVNHSDAKLLLAAEAIYEKIDFAQMSGLTGVFAIEGNVVLDCKDGTCADALDKSTKTVECKFPKGLDKDLFVLPEVSNSELAMISYTSGTTGNSKGVMLLHNSLAANIRFAQNNMPLQSGDSLVSFLPLAHAYGLAFEFLFPFTLGCHITFLTKTPSPQIITQAFAEIKPRLILSVPLVIEKIYKKKLLPTISKPAMKFMLAVPGVNKILYNSIRKKLEAVFGGNFHEVVIGGAAFNAEAESFFKKIKFPFTIGYGMTECGPLISYAPWNTTKLQASGRSVDTLKVKIDSEDPQNIVGEIMMKGDNVMEGYYKNEEATKQVLDEDGWLHSGDLGLIDAEGNIFIKGRSKSMLLGPSGQNIYPEEIESMLNNKYCVAESVVVEENHKLVALVYPDYDVVEKEKIDDAALEKIMEENKKELNSQVASYMNISKIEIHKEEFVKTPKRSIKRYLYAR